MTGGSGQVSEAEPLDALVVGAGPAGLMAAEELARAGRKVVIAEKMPSVARKFLMAGKSGLNLTKAEPGDAFRSHFGSAPAVLLDAIKDFGPEEVEAFATELGQDVFRGSTGRVYPRAMKASPLLRAWLRRLDAMGVTIRTRWTWTGWSGTAMIFDTENGSRGIVPEVAVLALGGASWKRLGSDGRWASCLASQGIETTPFQPANVGFRVNWSAHMTPFLGQPVKGTRQTAGDLSSRGEWIVSARGIEGGGIYEVSAAARDGAPMVLDIAPDLTAAELETRLRRSGRKASTGERLRKAGISGVVRALVQEWGRPLTADPEALARLLKALPMKHAGPRPMDEAISVAGGVAWSALDDSLMLKARPGVFCAGEMLDWEAPTGGYLITACLATGRFAGRAAAQWPP